MIEGFTGLGGSKSTGRGSFFSEDEARLKADVVASTPLPITLDPTDRVMEGFVRFSNYMTENIRASENPTITDLINADGNLRSIVPNGFILIANKLDALIQRGEEGEEDSSGKLRLGGGSSKSSGAVSAGSVAGGAVSTVGASVGSATTSAVGAIDYSTLGVVVGGAINSVGITVGDSINSAGIAVGDSITSAGITVGDVLTSAGITVGDSINSAGVTVGDVLTSAGVTVGDSINSAVGTVDYSAMGTAMGVALVPPLVGAVDEFTNNAMVKLNEVASNLYEQSVDLSNNLIYQTSLAYSNMGNQNGTTTQPKPELMDIDILKEMMAFDKGNAWNQRMLSLYIGEGGSNFTSLPKMEDRYNAYRTYLEWRDDNGWNSSGAQQFESFMRENYRESTAQLYSKQMKDDSLFDAEFSPSDTRLSTGYRGYYSDVSDDMLERLIETLEKNGKAVEDNTRTVEGNTRTVEENTSATEVGSLVATTSNGGQGTTGSQVDVEAIMRSRKKSFGFNNKALSINSLVDLGLRNPTLLTGAYGSTMPMISTQLMSPSTYLPLGATFGTPATVLTGGLANVG